MLRALANPARPPAHSPAHPPAHLQQQHRICKQLLLAEWPQFAAAYAPSGLRGTGGSRKGDRRQSSAGASPSSSRVGALSSTPAPLLLRLPLMQQRCRWRWRWGHLLVLRLLRLLVRSGRLRLCALPLAGPVGQGLTS